MTDEPRIQCKALAGKVMPAEQAAAFITPGDRAPWPDTRRPGAVARFGAAFVPNAVGTRFEL